MELPVRIELIDKGLQDYKINTRILHGALFSIMKSWEPIPTSSVLKYKLFYIILPTYRNTQYCHTISVLVFSQIDSFPPRGFLANDFFLSFDEWVNIPKGRVGKSCQVNPEKKLHNTKKGQQFIKPIIIIRIDQNIFFYAPFVDCKW